MSGLAIMASLVAVESLDFNELKAQLGLTDGNLSTHLAALERDLDALLAVFDLPARHRKMLRTTNAIERCFREVRRRTRSIGCFVNDASLERMIYGLFRFLNERRAGKPCS